MVRPSIIAAFRVVVLAALSIVSAAGMQAGIKSRRMLAKIGEHTPVPVLVSAGFEMEIAEQEAAKVGGTVLWGVGESMEPLYAPKTAVVVTAMDYDDIKKGMTVVYRKPNGRYVAHAVVGEDAKGYIVQGMNNDVPDELSVNEKNLVGVITAAFSANDTQFRAAIARRAGDTTKAVAATRGESTLNKL